MKINCYIALVAAALGCACNPLADTDDMDNNVQATRIAFSPEVVTLDNAGGTPKRIRDRTSSSRSTPRHAGRWHGAPRRTRPKRGAR